MNSKDSLSKYVDHLQGQDRSRYKLKCEVIGISDVYNLPAHIFKPIKNCAILDLPDFSYHDLYNYLVNKQSHYTGKALKAYKSLEAYNYFLSGWVSGILVWKIPNKDYFLVTSKVTHSQALSTPPLKPWVIIKSDGEVMTAHCTCMAGLGEACSHIAATLFAIEAAVKRVMDTSCTSLPCVWSDTSTGKINFAEGNEIDFTSPETKRIALMKKQIPKPQLLKVRDINSPTMEENKNLYSQLMGTGVRCSVLSVIPDYAEQFTPRSVRLDLPDPLSELYDEMLGKLPLRLLNKECEDTFLKIQITPEKALVIELETRSQSKSKIWYQQRSGRITASVFKAACRTNPENPSIALIKRICYPESYKFSTEATRYGCSHEQSAFEDYCNTMKNTHHNFESSKCGLIINPEYPIFGASPDGHINCSCCGKGILEIKCPYCLEDQPFDVLAGKKDFCLDKCTFKLDRTHAYFYQVQLQLFLSKAEYCDFVVWRKEEFYVERITLDKKFIDGCIEQAKLFYVKGIMPELLGKWYTRPHLSNRNEENITSDKDICYCQKSDARGKILVCQFENCKIVNFHQTCLGLKNIPKKPWLCPDCRTLKNKEKL